jgi:hypothetical protein
MESTRWLRLAPLALAVAAGAVGIGRPMVGAAGDPPWEPPPCPAGEAAGPPGVAAWYRLDPALDKQGSLASMHLTVGVAGAPVRWLSLAPESFATGPVGGRILAGTDDGSATRLALVDPERGCLSAMADEAAVIRSAVLTPDGRSVFEHRVDRTTRADLGIWRRPIGADGTAAGDPVRVLPGLASDALNGRTFTTELLLAQDGRLVVSSCGLEACRDRVLDPSTGMVTVASGVGPAVGLDGGRLVARSACAGDPCAIVAVDLATGTREVIVEAAFAAAMDGGALAYEEAGGRVATLELATGRRSGPIDAGGVPLQRGSLAASGADVPAGTVALGPAGRATAAGTRALDVLRLTTTTLEEVQR